MDAHVAHANTTQTSNNDNNNCKASDCAESSDNEEAFATSSAHLTSPKRSATIIRTTTPSPKPAIATTTPTTTSTPRTEAPAASPASSNSSRSSCNSPTTSTNSSLNTSNATIDAANENTSATATAAQEMSAASGAAATLDMKPKSLELLPAQKIKKLVRRNASDKLRLIQMVHDNPILWDSRLPNFKGAEEEKNRAWEQIGKEFNAPGRRVARAFKSLRESYRRELAHVKLMGSGFKPKWSLYDAMDFLRDVIRERKGGSHAAENAAIGVNLSAFSQHLHHNNNNNNKSALKFNPLHSLYNESALNLSKCSSLNMSHEDEYYFVKPELDLAAAAAAAAAAAGAHGNGVTSAAVAAAAAAMASQHPLPAHQHQQSTQQQQQQLHSQQQQQLHNAPHDSRVSSTRNDSNAQNSTFDDLDASSMRSGDEASMRNAALSHQGSDEVEELEAIDADFPYPLILDSNSPRGGGGGNCGGGGGGGGGGNGASVASKRKRRDLSMDGDGGDDDDDYEGQMLQQHRHLRQQNGGSMSCMLDMPQAQTVREVLNSKFCGFISAKLNSMEDTEADNLMNKILMLLVQTQGNEAK